MTQTKHHHAEPGERTSGGDLNGPYWKRAHQDWKFWIALSLMLTAMVIYITTLDLSVQPNVKSADQLKQPLP